MTLSLSLLSKRVRSKMKANKTLTASFYPPTLTGGQATDFIQNQTDAKNDCLDALDDAFFTGITPSTKTLPPSTELIDWLDGLAGDAKAVVDDPSPTQAEKQDAADNFQTIAANSALAITTYT